MADPPFDQIDDEPIAPSPIRRTLVIAVSLLVVTVLAGIPVLRAITDARTRDPEDAAREARAHVARQFTLAALEQRSTRLAAEWVLDDLRDEVDAVVGDLQRRESAEFEGAVASVRRVLCTAADRADAASECFLARLARPGSGGEVTSVRFVVGIVDGRATVVSIGERRVAVVPDG